MGGGRGRSLAVISYGSAVGLVRGACGGGLRRPARAGCSSTVLPVDGVGVWGSVSGREVP